MGSTPARRARAAERSHLQYESQGKLAKSLGKQQYKIMCPSAGPPDAKEEVPYSKALSRRAHDGWYAVRCRQIGGSNPPVFLNMV